jgi:hypothetical protein
MRKLNTCLLLVLVSLLPLISAASLYTPALAAPSEDLVGTFGGLEKNEQLEYKIWIPEDAIEWLNNPNTINGLITFLNYTGIMNETEATALITALNVFINNILDARMLFTITEVIQPNTTSLYPYGNVKAEMDITGFNYTQLYSFLSFLGILNETEVPYSDFLANVLYYTTDIPVNLDFFTFLLGPQWPDRPADPTPNVTVPIVYNHYQPDDLYPYPLEKFTNWEDVNFYVWGINPIDTVIIEHNGTGTMEQEEMWNWWAPDYYLYVNVTGVGYKDWWAYRFFVNDTSGNNITTAWHYKCKSGAVANLPLIIPNNFDYWAGYLDAFMDMLGFLLDLLDFPIIQHYDFTLNEHYITHRDGGTTQNFLAAHLDLSINTTYITQIIIDGLLGLSDSDKIDIWLTLDNYTDWLYCFHESPITLEAYFAQQHGFVLRADIAMNLTHILNKWEIFIVRVLQLLHAPPYVIGNVTAALDFLKVGMIGFGIECTWYNSIEHVVFEIPWWIWLIIGVAVAIAVGFYLGWMYRGQRGFWARRTIIYTR